MDYIFGNETLKTVGEAHTELTGWQEIVRDYGAQVITDCFRVVRKIKSAEDPAGQCYDWYEITGHYRMIDSTQPVREKVEQNRAFLDYMSMMTGVQLTEGGGT